MTSVIVVMRPAWLSCLHWLSLLLVDHSEFVFFSLFDSLFVSIIRENEQHPGSSNLPVSPVSLPCHYKGTRNTFFPCSLCFWRQFIWQSLPVPHRPDRFHLPTTRMRAKPKHASKPKHLLQTHANSGSVLDFHVIYSGDWRKKKTKGKTNSKSHWRT